MLVASDGVTELVYSEDDQGGVAFPLSFLCQSKLSLS